VADLGLLLDDDLGVAGDAGREVRRQTDRLVQGVGVQGLRPAQGRREGLERRADHVVVGVLLREAPSGGLAVGPQDRGAGVLRAELADRLVPEVAGRPQHGDLHEEVHADAEEEGEPRGEIVDGEAAVDGRPDILLSVGQREGRLQHRVGARLHDVVAADGDRVVARHVLGTVGDDVRDDPHRGLRRVDVGVAGEEFLEDVVLDRACQLLLLHALLLGGHDVARQDGEHGAVHRHGDGHLVQRDPVKEDLHVLDGIDGHAGLAHVAGHAGMIGVVAAVRRQVEGDRKARLACGEVSPVEGVRLPGRGEPGVLADRPGMVGVHGGHGAADVGGHAGEGVDEIQSFQVFRRVEGLHGDPFGCLPVERLHGLALELLGDLLLPFLHLGVFSHLFPPCFSLCVKGLFSRADAGRAGSASTRVNVRRFHPPAIRRPRGLWAIGPGVRHDPPVQEIANEPDEVFAAVIEPPLDFLEIEREVCPGHSAVVPEPLPGEVPEPLDVPRDLAPLPGFLLAVDGDAGAPDIEERARQGFVTDVETPRLGLLTRHPSGKADRQGEHAPVALVDPEGQPPVRSREVRPEQDPLSGERRPVARPGQKRPHFLHFVRVDGDPQDPEPALDGLEIQRHLMPEPVGRHPQAEVLQEAPLPVRGYFGGVPVRLVELARQAALTAPPLPRGQSPEISSAASRTSQHDRLCLRGRNLPAKQVQPTWGIVSSRISTAGGTKNIGDGLILM